MLVSRQVWDSYRILYNTAPASAHEDATFSSWVAENYLRRQAMAIRRQVDTHRDVISLAHLIQRVRRYPDVLSRERYLKRTAGWLRREEANRVFDSIFGVGHDHIDANIPRADLATLKTRTAKVVDWVTNEVAHYNKAKGTFGTGLQFRDLDDSIDLIAHLSVKYREWILGSSMLTTVAMYPWVHIFREAWLRDDEHERRVVEEAERIQDKRAKGERLEDDE